MQTMADNNLPLVHWLTLTAALVLDLEAAEVSRGLDNVRERKKRVSRRQ